jgi:hypothetical protein
MVNEGQGKRELFDEIEVMQNDSVNEDSRRTMRNKSSGVNARAVSAYSNDTWDGLDYTLKIGVTSSNYTGSPDSENCGFIQNDTPTRFRVCNLMNAPIKFSINFTGDRTLGNVSDVAEISETTGALKLNFGLIQLNEITTPTAVENYGAIYTKTDNRLYFQDGAGAEHKVEYADIKDRVSVYKSADQSVLQTSWADVTFDQERYDVGDMHDNATNNERVTINTTGLYRISYNINIQSKKDKDFQARVYKNGISLLPDSQICFFSPKDDIDICIHNSFDAELSAGDYITLQAYNGHTSSRLVRAVDTYFQVRKVE